MRKNEGARASDLEIFGRLVHERRKARGWTLENLAAAVFGNEDRKGRLSQIENGKVSNLTPNSVKQIADELAIDFREIPSSLRWRQALEEGIRQLERLIPRDPRELPDPAAYVRANEEISRFQTIVQSSEYRTWQLAATRALYSRHLNVISSKVQSFPTIGEHQYPIIIIPSEKAYSLLRSKPNDLVVEHRPIYPNRDLLITNGLSVDDLDLSPSQMEYLSAMILAGKVTRPNQPGYALSRLSLNPNGKASGFTARTCHYMDNVRTCHHLEYVFANAFQSRIDPRDVAKYADKLGHPFIDIEDDGTSLAVSGRQEMYPLISVQAICLSLRKGEWRVAYVQRSKNVSTAAGAYQFVPAGGFETIGGFDLSDLTGRERGRLKDGFDVQDALLREFLEETFGDRTMVDGAGAADIYKLPGLLLCRKLLAEKRLELRSLGVIFDLVRLRPEFSYLIILRDDEPGDLKYETRGNQNSTPMIANFGFTNLSEAEELDFMPLAELRSRLHSERWHESSAGLGHLALMYLEQDAEFSCHL